MVDQLRYYSFSKLVEKISGAGCIYDDMWVRRRSILNGMEFDRLISENHESFRKKLVSSILSERLKRSIYSIILKHGVFADILHKSGCRNLVLVTDDHGASHWIPKARIPRLVIDPRNWDDILMATSKAFRCYLFHGEPELYYKENYSSYLHESIRLPDFRDEMNKNVANEMLENDAVVMHIRRGDMVSMPEKSDDETEFHFFSTTIKKVLEIKDYPSKKYYVISDDIQYVRQHESDFGLDMVNKNLRYIDHNKNENSIFDLKLLTYGKIILITVSNFARLAGHLSKRKEIFISSSAYVNALISATGWKNKYDLNL